MTWPFADRLSTNSALPGNPAIGLSSFADFLRRQAGRGHLAQPIERVGLAQERVGDQDARALSAALGRGAVGRRRSALEIAERPRDGRFREVDARVTRGDGGEAAQLRQRFHGLVALSARARSQVVNAVLHD